MPTYIATHCKCPCQECPVPSVTDPSGLPSLCQDCDRAGCEPGQGCLVESDPWAEYDAFREETTTVVERAVSMAELVFGEEV